VSTFAFLVALCEQLASTRSRLVRTKLVADYLRGLDPDETAIASRLLVGRPFPDTEGRRLSLGGRAIFDALEDIGVAVKDSDWGTAEDLGALVQAVLASRSRSGVPLSLTDVRDAFVAIAGSAGPGSRRQRLKILGELIARSEPVESKYLAKIVIGEMRHGVDDGIVLEALAALAGVPAAEIRRAHQALGDLGRLATLVRSEPLRLAQVGIRLFQPIRPMLAQTAPDVISAFNEHGGRLSLEWKLDGARVQVHKRGDEVRLFSRRLKDITASLPDVVESIVRAGAAETAIFEGEVLAIAGDRPLPFQELMRRFRRIRGVEAAAREIPVRLYLFDLLLLGEEPLIARGAETRWSALQDARGDLACVARVVPADAPAAQAFLRAALDAGHEGVMAKGLGSAYTPGVRGSGWLKVKRCETLDLVIVAADWGYGRRHGWLSNYHLAARDPATGNFVPIGKTFKGLTDTEFRHMTERLLRAKIRDSGNTVVVRPEVVVEVLFGDVQRSPQYSCGMALRFARIARIRDDKHAGEVDSIDTVREIFMRQTVFPAGTESN
jgi:DNA ligase-1